MMRFLLLFIPFLLFATKPELLLLNVYKDQNISGWVVSEKLDGIRAYWDGEHLISRGGKVIHAPEWFTKEYPPFPIDGELWSKRKDFEHISSIVRDKVPSPEWQEIKHYIFEVPNAKGGLFERLALVKPYEGKSIEILSQKVVKNKKELTIYLKKIEALGGEGVVVRDPNTPYIAKRTSKALKVKSFLDAECEVVRHIPGKGKYKDVIGSIECKLKDGTRFKIGSGFSDEERKSPPQVGDIVTFKYQEMTKYNKPRFPVFLRVREASAKYVKVKDAK